jgi:hypothetical protein
LRKLWWIVLGSAAALIPVRADASALQFDGMGAHDIVTIGGTSGVSGSYYAGELNWEWQAPTPDGFDTYLYTYCVDILHEVVDPQTVAISDTTDPLMVTQATDGGAKAAWLLNTYAPDIHTSGNGIDAAALQVAIWEAISDDDHNLATGVFTLLTTNTYTSEVVAQAIFARANDYLGALFYDGQNYHTSVATWLDATTATGGGQDQIATPEPSSLLLLGIAGIFVKRRKPQSQ